MSIPKKYFVDIITPVREFVVSSEESKLLSCIDFTNEPISSHPLKKTLAKPAFVCEHLSILTYISKKV